MKNKGKQRKTKKGKERQIIKNYKNTILPE